MTTTDDARLLEIEAREQAATAGPWVDYDNVLGAHIIRAKDADIATVYVRYMVADARERDANAAFIAHSREDVRFLLDRLKAAESRIRELEEAVWTAGFALIDIEARTETDDGGTTYPVWKIASNAREAIGHINLRSDDVQEEGNGG